MKKVMFMVAMVAATAAVADVTSANIVGYQAVGKGAVKQPMFGFTFTPVSGAVTNSTIKLGSVTVSGMTSADSIQVINPTTLGLTTAYTYYSDDQARADAAEGAEDDTGATEGEDYEEAYAEYYDEFKEDVGWWVAGKVGKNSAADVDVTVGSGFLVLSPSAHDIKFTCSGEAPTSARAFSPGAVKQPIISNFLPTKLYLKDILVSGMTSADSIQVINPTTLGLTTAYTYYSDDQARADAAEGAEDDTGATEGEDYEEAYAEYYDEFKEDVGWWIAGKVGKNSADEVVVEAGDAFLGLSPSAHSLTFNFKSVLDLTPVSE